MTKKDIFKALTYHKRVEILITIYEAELKETFTYSLQIAKNIDCHSEYTQKIIRRLEDAGLVDIGKKEGRIRVVSLTNKGKKVAEEIMEIKRLLKDNRWR